MLKNLIVLSDGTEIFSGIAGMPALKQVNLTQQVNDGAELTLGAACAGKLDATIFTYGGDVPVSPGMELTLYKVTEGGERRKAGLFTVEKTTRPSANLYRIIAYDRVGWLEKDLGDWLDSLSGWPYSLLEFARMVCAACNVTLLNETLPNGNWQVQKFSARGISGRQLMQWVGQACGRFCRATTQGDIELAWYTPKDITLTWGGELPVLAMQRADYQTALIDKVQIGLTEKDIGAICGTGSNCYHITGNYLLSTEDLEPLQAVAQELYDILKDVTYTPCKVKLPANTEIQPGDILWVTDRMGAKFSVYAMQKIQTGPTETVECVGSAHRDSVTARNDFKLTNLYGSVLELQMSMEGVRAENRRADGRTAALEMSVEGLKTEAIKHDTGLSDISTRMTTVEQNAEGLSIQVRNINTDGVSKVNTTTGYIFDETGITVKKSGREIKTQITEDGMQVFKSGNVVLTANSEGVDAVDLHASTYLAVGGRSRFENYGDDRTGCFWIGG